MTIPLHMIEYDHYDDKLNLFKNLCITLLSSGIDPLTLMIWIHQTDPIYKKKLTTDFILEIEEEAAVLDTLLPVDDSCITIVNSVLIDVEIRFSPEVYIFVCLLCPLCPLYVLCILCILSFFAENE